MTIKTKLADAEKIQRIKNIIALAEDWPEEQVLPQSEVCISALKDIRRVIRK